jgi:formamidopyrimidine-DNA glycosylase
MLLAMPELPEVETVARALRPRLAGRRIRRVQILSRRIVSGPAEEFAARLCGRRIRGLRRRGKFLLAELEGAVLAIHLGMTGSLRWNAAPGPHTRAIFFLDRGRLVFDDLRQFGRLEASEQAPARLAGLGPEALEISAQELRRRLRGRRAALKALLLDQRILAGLGNIYADEALFRARIHPCAAPARLSAARLRRLHQAIREVLQEAIRAGGSSVSDYVDPDGDPGRFQFEHRVYRRTGLPCPRCGALIRRLRVAQRSTHYCPRCQRP